MEVVVMRPMSRVLVPVLGFVAMMSVGCPKKAPKAAPAAEPTAAPVDIAPRPETTSSSDPKASPLDADLAAANDYARQNGLLGDVYFDFDRAELKGEARERLAQNARFLAERPEFVVTLEGHCDERGTGEYNLALGQSRSTMARGYLTSLGISPDRLISLSLGEERPVCTASDESCWQQNRRVHFVLTGRLPAGN
jgi:peptidoglycan-associated lipoprotein